MSTINQLHIYKYINQPNKFFLLHNSAKVLLFHPSLWIWQPAYNVWQQIIDGIILREETNNMIKQRKRNKKYMSYNSQISAYLCSEFIEKVDCKAGNMWLRVKQECSNLANLTFDLHHIF